MPVAVGERWASPGAAALGALSCYLWTASAHGYWLDGGELLAAAVSLGVSHPPGHPLHGLVGRLFAYLPLGPLALRVALASAACAALGAAALCVAVRRTLALQGLSQATLARPIAFGATLWVVLCHGYWLQAVRPEVYGLQAALGMLTLERALALLQHGPRASTLASAGLVVGLGLANHHLSTLLLLPLFAVPLWRALSARRLRALGLAAGAALLGLATYVYLPLRAAAHPLPNLGVPTDLARLWWVVSAQVYQRALSGFTPEPLASRAVDVLIVLGENLHLVAVVAIGGAYVALRRARAAALLWLAALALPAGTRALAGFVRSNPDAAAFLLASFAALGALAAVLVAEVARALAPLRPRAARLLALGVVALGMAQLPRSAPAASLAGFDALDAFADPLRRDLPPRAVVIAHVPDVAFALWGGMVEERARPDLLVVPVVLLGYPGMPASLARRAPELAPLLSRIQGRDLAVFDILSLSAHRTTLVEMDPQVPPSLWRRLRPDGLYYRVGERPFEPRRLQAGIAGQRHAYRRLYARLDRPIADVATRHRLLWRHFADALYYMAMGERPAALSALSRAQALAPEARPLSAMARAAAAPGSGPIDVTPFVAELSRLP